MAGPGIFDRDLLQAFAPTVTPPTANLITTGFAPVLKLGIIPPTTALTIATFAPTVTMGIRVIPSTVALTLSTFAPTVTTPRLVIPGTKALALTTFAPTVTAAANRVVVPTTASLTLTQFDAVVTATGQAAPSQGGGGWDNVRQKRKTEKPKRKPVRIHRNVKVTPLTARLSITSHPPTALARRNVVVTPGTAPAAVFSRRPMVVVKPSRQALAAARAAKPWQPEPMTAAETVRAHERAAAVVLAEPALSLEEIDAQDLRDLELVGSLK